nr:RNA-directed DNA polymerase, eukaryota, reverse transcriptase zinc-binding domain protein [Tanacetum cinerariifolium]
MLNKENYVPWSSRLLRYAKSRPNEKLIYNSIINGPYRRMIPEPGDANREVPVPETFHEQTDDELTEAEIKQMEADDQAIHTILLGSDIGIQDKKAKLFNEWERFTSSDEESIESYYHRFSKLMADFKRNKHFPKKIANYTQLYDFLKYNQNEVDELRAEPLEKTHDPLALMANSNNPFNYPVFHQDQPSPNGPLMVNVIVDWYKRKKAKLMIFKIDFEKAFDLVSRDFLDQVLQLMGFGHTRRSWIRGCLSSAKASILINGSPTAEFNLQRGLRQGDPISPFLFILVMEGLHVAIKAAINAGLFYDAKLHSFHVSYLFFADDVLLLEELSSVNVSNLVNLLNCFYKVSGLKLNLHNCNLFGVGVDHSKVISRDFLDQVLQFRGFGHTRRSWIRGCLSSAKASILVNGSPTAEFNLQRGLRQGILALAFTPNVVVHVYGLA